MRPAAAWCSVVLVSVVTACAGYRTVTAPASGVELDLVDRVRERLCETRASRCQELSAASAVVDACEKPRCAIVSFPNTSSISVPVGFGCVDTNDVAVEWNEHMPRSCKGWGWRLAQERYDKRNLLQPKYREMMVTCFDPDGGTGWCDVCFQDGHEVVQWSYCEHQSVDAGTERN